MKRLIQVGWPCPYPEPMSRFRPEYTEQEKREQRERVAHIARQLREYLEVNRRAGLARRHAERLRRARAAQPPCPICGLHSGFHDQTEGGPHSRARALIPPELKR